MNYLNITAIAVFGFVFAGSMNTANAAEVNVNLDDNVNNPSAYIQIQGTDKTAYNLDNIEGSNIKQDGQIYNLQGDIERANTAINKAQDTANTAQDGVNANTQALAGKVDKSIFDADQDRQDHALQDASDKATQAFNTGAYAQSLAVDAQTVAAANKAAVANVQSRQQGKHKKRRFRITAHN
ncbi:hypothetical protein ACOY7H_00825 [Enterobacter roggenkampii]|uniref:hypothetical protein n=1 Tax=Enterobacter roggenkampii TaxID=1812935 RepID=UPI003BCE6BE4